MKVTQRIEASTLKIRKYKTGIQKKIKVISKELAELEKQHHKATDLLRGKKAKLKSKVEKYITDTCLENEVNEKIIRKIIE
ncbi:MAG: hypothetical protein HN704_18340 [Bacteroidetes bacterium]|mgnify:CR=1 FL=1|jgi:hypothetical protein|nr:hypothetical protein [Bacteroidota bacterium]MBT7493563.1 hypothetical protein [Bacteroidota bacterium]